MEDLRKAMTKKLLETMRKNIQNTAIYVRSKLEEGNYPCISIINERYVIANDDPATYTKVKHDHIIIANYPTVNTAISMAMSDVSSIDDRHMVLLDGVARYFDIYYSKLMSIPYIRKHKDVETIICALRQILDTDYYAFLVSPFKDYEDCDSLDNLRSEIHKRYTIDPVTLRRAYITNIKYVSKLLFFKNASSVGIIPCSVRDYLPDYPFLDIVPLEYSDDDGYSKRPQYVIKVNNGELHKIFMQKGKSETAMVSDLLLIEYLHRYYLQSMQLGRSLLSRPDDDEYIDVNVSIKLSIKRDVYDEVKSIENHAEEFLNLNNWPEVEDIRDVHVDRIEGPSEISFNTKYFDKESELAMRAMRAMIDGLQSFGEQIADDVDQTVEPEIPTESTGANFYDILDKGEK